MSVIDEVIKANEGYAGPNCGHGSQKKPIMEGTRREELPRVA